MGEKFRDVVRQCLEAESPNANSPDDDKVGITPEDVLLNFEASVVVQLEKLSFR